MKNTMTIKKAAELTARTAIGTAAFGAKITAMAAPGIFAANIVVNKICTGAWNAKKAVIDVAKDAAIGIATVTAINTAITATNTTIAAIKSIASVDDELNDEIEEFDWDDEE